MKLIGNLIFGISWACFDSSPNHPYLFSNIYAPPHDDGKCIICDANSVWHEDNKITNISVINLALIRLIRYKRRREYQRDKNEKS